MKLVLSKNATKFLKKISTKESEKIKSKILLLLSLVETSESTIYEKLDVKLLKGEWQGFLRLRVGRIRVIFTLDLVQDELLIYAIDFRGDIY